MKKKQTVLIEESDLKRLRAEKEKTGILMHRLMGEILKELPEVEEPAVPTLKPIALRLKDTEKLQRNAKSMGMAPWRLVKMLLKKDAFEKI